MKSSEELQHSLERLVALHRNLVELLNEEYAHMGSLDVKGLADVAHAKEVMLSEIWNHEQLRMKCVEQLAAGLYLDPHQTTLLQIAEKLPSDQAEKLRNARTALTLLMKEAKDLNTRNMAFAEASLSRIEIMKRNALGQGNNAVKENYSSAGTRQPVTEQGGRLLSTEA